MLLLISSYTNFGRKITYTFFIYKTFPRFLLDFTEKSYLCLDINYAPWDKILKFKIE